eukprot:CFRG7055T1
MMSLETFKVGDSERVRMKLNDDTHVDIALFGGTVISYVADGRELIFVSSTAVWDNKKAIRGGIPVVFPNFGPWELGPQHGFARISTWEFVEPQDQPEDAVVATFVLKDSEETRKLWNHSFELQINVMLNKDGFFQELSVENTGEDEFDFTSLLHTYFRCDDIAHVAVEGLQGSGWKDKVSGDAAKSETRVAVKIDSFVDSVYTHTPVTHTIKGLAGKDTPLKVTLEKENLPDTVIWNPWDENAASMGDFDDEGYNNMICVEAGSVDERVVLGPKETWVGRQAIKPEA